MAQIYHGLRFQINEEVNLVYAFFEEISIATIKLSNRCNHFFQRIPIDYVVGWSIWTIRNGAKFGIASDMFCTGVLNSQNFLNDVSLMDY